MPLGTLERSAPPLFKQGPSALSRLAAFSALALFLMVADTRFKLADAKAQATMLRVFVDHCLAQALADPRVRFIANPDNPGFGTACNQGAFDSVSTWLAFVNPDCLVEADTLARLRAHALACGREALLGVDLVDEAGVRDGAARRRDPDFAAMLRSAASESR